MEEKRKSLKVLSVQMSSIIGDKEANFHKVMDLINSNLKKGTDLVVLPEVWNVGWKPSEFENSAEDLDNSPTIEFLSELAIAYNVNIIGGSFITRRKDAKRTGGIEKSFDYYNTCPVINRKGELVAAYDKMHLYSYYGCDEGKFVKKGQNPAIVELDGVKIGLTICYDIRFPEIYRALACKGADMFVCVAAWGLHKELVWETLTRARAIENQCYMIALTQSGQIEGNDWNLGHSRVISYDGSIIGEIGVGDSKETSVEGAFTSELKFEEMYEFRKKCTVLLDICDTYEVE